MESMKAITNLVKENMKNSTKAEEKEWVAKPPDDWEEKIGIPKRFQDVKPAEWKNNLIIGPAGSGKSYLAAQMVKSLKGPRINAIWVNVPKLLFDFRRDFDREIVERVLRKDYVVLDDLGAEHTTDWVAGVIYIIVNSVWENQKNLAVTSNLKPSEIGKRFGDRLASRILDICKVQEMKDKDRRLEK